MSVCAHDPSCPGHGEIHDKAQSIPDADWKLMRDFAAMKVPARNPNKDRSKAGKKRKQGMKGKRITHQVMGELQ